MHKSLYCAKKKRKRIASHSIIRQPNQPTNSHHHRAACVRSPTRTLPRHYRLLQQVRTRCRYTKLLTRIQHHPPCNPTSKYPSCRTAPDEVHVSDQRVYTADDPSILQSGRHRVTQDGRYKYVGREHSRANPTRATHRRLGRKKKHPPKLFIATTASKPFANV